MDARSTVEEEQPGLHTAITSQITPDAGADEGRRTSVQYCAHIGSVTIRTSGARVQSEKNCHILPAHSS